MRPLRYSINVTLDGCVDHRAGVPSAELHRHHAANLERADALLFGRVTYEMMEDAWRRTPAGTWPDWMAEWMIPFAETIGTARKYVVSATLDRVDWNAELVRGDLGDAVRRLKQEPGEGLYDLREVRSPVVYPQPARGPLEPFSAHPAARSAPPPPGP